MTGTLTSWADGPMCLFDTETTGPDPLTARLVTATVIRFEPGADLDTRSWLADPGIDIPAEASGIHGVSTEHAREHGRPLSEVVAEVAAALGDAWEFGYPVVGYNVTYDLTLMAAECGRMGEAFACAGPVIDGRVLDQYVDRYRPGKRTLTDVCAHYRVRLDGAHDATADALAAGRVAWAIARRYPRVARLSLQQLHDRQAVAHTESQNGFADYLCGPKVLGQVTDQAERAAIRERAAGIRAVAGQWPIRGAA